MNAAIPLFGDENSVLGMEPDDLCRHMVGKLRSAASEQNDDFDVSEDRSVEYLRDLTKGDLLQQATSLCVRLSDLVPLKVDETIMAAYRDEAEERKVTMIANTGEVSSELANVRIMLQFDAIDAVCRGKSPTPDVKKIRAFRERLEQRLIR